MSLRIYCIQCFRCVCQKFGGHHWNVYPQTPKKMKWKKKHTTVKWQKVGFYIKLYIRCTTIEKRFFFSIWLKPKQSQNVKNIAGGYWRVSLIMWLKLVIYITFENHFTSDFIYIYYISTIQITALCSIDEHTSRFCVCVCDNCSPSFSS